MSTEREAMMSDRNREELIALGYGDIVQTIDAIFERRAKSTYTAEDLQCEAFDYQQAGCQRTADMLRYAAALAREKAEPVAWADLPDIESSAEFFRQCRLHWERFITEHRGGDYQHARRSARKRVAHFANAEKALTHPTAPAEADEFVWRNLAPDASAPSTPSRTVKIEVQRPTQADYRERLLDYADRLEKGEPWMHKGFRFSRWIKDVVADMRSDAGMKREAPAT